ncbi:MAG: CHAD domain-containing protein [Acidimicrobiia bacterium]|nr:CHAD domain-containing protein [Acidimicrobiia bacterium]
MPRRRDVSALMQQPLRMLRKSLPAAVDGDVTALHQARVATRRLREALPLASDDRQGRKVEKTVRRITRALGPVRESDVAADMLEELAHAGRASRVAMAHLRHAVDAERETRRERMRRRLEACDLAGFMKRARTVADPGRSVAEPAEQLRRARARAAVRAARLTDAVEEASGLYVPTRLHDVRISVKRLRYALELVRELSGSRRTARLAALKRMQDLLGKMHDLEMLVARIRALKGAAGAPSPQVSAELDDVVRRIENECRLLHGHYVASRDTLLRICAEAIAGAPSRAA